jgi:hypothetical protein
MLAGACKTGPFARSRQGRLYGGLVSVFMFRSISALALSPNHSWRLAAEPRSGVGLTPRAVAADGNLQYLTETAMPESKSTGASPANGFASALP